VHTIDTVDIATPRFTWWMVEDTPLPAESTTTESIKVYNGVEESLNHLKEFAQANGPFDVALGFSQGASLLSLLCAVHRRQQLERTTTDYVTATQSTTTTDRLASLLKCDLEWFNSVRGVIFVSGFIPRTPIFSHLYPSSHPKSIKPILETDNVQSSHNATNLFPITSFHVVGKDDTIIAPAESKRLMACFESPRLYEHPGGHIVPSDKLSREQFRQFLQTFIS
jgi:predicted esterase